MNTDHGMSSDKKHLTRATVIEKREVPPAKTIGFERRPVTDAEAISLTAPTASSDLKFWGRLKVYDAMAAGE